LKGVGDVFWRKRPAGDRMRDITSQARRAHCVSNL
jgi:hypothetical protein